MTTAHATLGALLPDMALPGSVRDLAISSIETDSRRVTPGALFVAVPGTKADGMAFAGKAVELGAVAVLYQEGGTEPPAGVPAVAVGDVRTALPQIAARLYPRQPGTIVAITGTNGKTSVAAFVRQIFSALGHDAASLGTVGLVTDRGEDYFGLTTPDPVALHRMLDRIAGEGATHLAVEASSHGLSQHRLDGLRLTAGAFTNLSRDHLDYHRDLDDYRDAKLRLFTQVLPAGARAVVCADDDAAPAFIEAARGRGLDVMTVGEAGEGIALVAREQAGYGQRLRVRHAGREHVVDLPLPGGFQAENALVAAGLAISCGEQPEKVFAALAHLKGAKGRLEQVGEIDGAMVVVDYAHTPDALANALVALRPYATGRLIALFGAGGDRDPGKRPLMGAAARAHADLVYVTDDNPRSEEPAAIRRAILGGVPEAREIGDRAEAIATAIGELKAGDVLLIAGKGHETGQIIGDRTLPFSDHEAVMAAIGGSR